MRPTELGTIGRAAREIFDVAHVRTVFTARPALLALGLGTSVFLPPNGHSCASYGASDGWASSAASAHV